MHHAPGGRSADPPATSPDTPASALAPALALVSALVPVSAPCPGREHETRPLSRITPDSAPHCPGGRRYELSDALDRQLPPPSVVRVRRQRSTANDRRGRRVPEGRRGGAPAACSGGPAHRVWSRGSCPMVTKALPRPAGAAGGGKPGGHARTRTPARGHTAGHQAGPSHARPQPDPPDQVHPQAWHRPDEVHVMITNSPRSARTRLLQHVPAPLPPPAPSRNPRVFAQQNAEVRALGSGDAGCAGIDRRAGLRGARRTGRTADEARGSNSTRKHRRASPGNPHTRGQRDHPDVLRQRSTIPEPVTPLPAEYRLRMPGQGGVAARRR